MGFNGILWDLMGFNGILWDLMGFNGINLVLGAAWQGWWVVSRAPSVSTSGVPPPPAGSASQPPIPCLSHGPSLGCTAPLASNLLHLWACQSWPSRSVLLGTSALHRGPPPLTSFLRSPSPSAQGWASHLPPATAPKHTRPTSSSPRSSHQMAPPPPAALQTARPLGRLATARTSHWWGFQPRPTPAWYTGGWRTRAHASRQPSAGAVSPPSSTRPSLLPSLHLPLPSSCNSPRMGLPP